MNRTMIDDLTPEARRLFRQEKLILGCTEVICGLMEKQGISKAELARRLGTTTGNITRLLNGANMKLRTVADVMGALDRSVFFSCPPPEWKRLGKLLRKLGISK